MRFIVKNHGGTVEAAAALIEEMGGEVVGMEFVIELEELKATEKLSKYNIYSQVKY